MIDRDALEDAMITAFARGARFSGMDQDELAAHIRAARTFSWLLETHYAEPAIRKLLDELRKALKALK